MQIPRTSVTVGAAAFDLDGTVYLEDQLLPGAREAVAALADAGIPYLFATNNSSVPASRYVERLRRMGLPADRRSVLTSNDAAVAHLSAAGVSRAYIVATPEVVAEYEGAGIRHDPADPQAVLLTFDTTLDYAKVRDAARLLRDGIDYVATHPDLVCPTAEGPIPDCGSFIALFKAATGREPLVVGKPSPMMAAAIRDRLGGGDARIAFVGDRLYTDVRMANEHGFLAVLTTTGEAGRADLAASPYVPDLVVDRLTDLLPHLGLEAVAAGPRAGSAGGGRS